MKAAVINRLTPQQIEFVQLHVVEGLPIWKAYARAFRLPETKHLNPRGAKILSHPHVAHYVVELRKELEERSKSERFLSIEEKRAFLAKIVRTPVGDLHPDHELVQEMKIGRDGTTLKMPPKLQAIELDAKLAGELREKLDVEVSPRIVEIAEDLE